MEKSLEVKIPSTPKFIFVRNMPISIAEFTDDELRKIGEMWTETLIAKAREGK